MYNQETYFFRDVIDKYPLSTYITFPDKTLYLTDENLTKLTESGFYDESEILDRIENCYYDSQIATRTIEQFYRLLNSLIERNWYKYLMNLVTISETYSIQNVDTRDITITHTPITDSESLLINNNTPGNKLNITNIKAGESASNVSYSKDTGASYEDVTHQEATSALNTTQSNIEAQLNINLLVQEALNSFIDELGEAFAICIEDYYE